MAFFGLHEQARLGVICRRVWQVGVCVPPVPALDPGRSLANNLGGSKGGFTSKINLRVNSVGLPMKVALSPGKTSDYFGYDAIVYADLPPLKVLLAAKE